MSNELLSLWDCLHDGTLEGLSSDLLERSITLLVDVPYLWTFHSLPESTRFRVLIQGVSEVEALRFTAWPGELVIPEGISWDDSTAIRKAFYEKGRLESADWQGIASRLNDEDKYEISHADLCFHEPDLTTLKVKLGNSTQNDYPEIRVTAEHVRFFLGFERELSLADFLDFGDAYWQAFAKRGSGSQ